MLQLANGKVPFETWYEDLDQLLQRAIDARLTRLAAGNFGDHKSVGAGVFELRVPKGPGLRIYYGLKGNELVVLIGGGDKSSQKRDIETHQSRENLTSNIDNSRSLTKNSANDATNELANE